MKKIMKWPRFLKNSGRFYSFFSFEIAIFSYWVLVVHQHVIGLLDFILLYLSCSQIWLSPLVFYHHFGQTWENWKKEKTSWRISPPTYLTSFCAHSIARARKSLTLEVGAWNKKA
jgi:hypothetical protein